MNHPDFDEACLTRLPRSDPIDIPPRLTRGQITDRERAWHEWRRNRVVYAEYERPPTLPVTSNQADTQPENAGDQAHPDTVSTDLGPEFEFLSSPLPSPESGTGSIESASNNSESDSDSSDHVPSTSGPEVGTSVYTPQTLGTEVVTCHHVPPTAGTGTEITQNTPPNELRTSTVPAKQVAPNRRFRNWLRALCCLPLRIDDSIVSTHPTHVVAQQPALQVPPHAVSEPARSSFEGSGIYSPTSSLNSDDEPLPPFPEGPAV